MNTFPGTILPQSSDTKEIQRSIFDLLGKVNSVGAGVMPTGISTLTYSSNVSLDASDGSVFIVTVMDTQAWALGAPANATKSQRITVMIVGHYGGAAGTLTWNSIYKMATWSMPSDGYSRSIDFVYNGTNWIEVSRTTADVPN